MINIDKKTLNYFKDKGSKKIKIFFYDAGCSGTKIDITDDFENHPLTSLEDHPLTPSLVRKGDNEYPFDIYVIEKDKDKFEDCSITRIIKADHTGKEKIRYIFKSNKIKDRCGCGSSFNFDGKKRPKLNLEKLNNLKNNFTTGKNTK